MKTLNLLLLIAGLLTFSACDVDGSNEEKWTNQQDQQDRTSEIQNVIVMLSSIQATDGEFDELQNGGDEETTGEIKSVEVENDKIRFCYDTQELVKIEVYGNVYEATVEFNSMTGKKAVISKGKDIEGVLTIVPSSSNDYLQGGKLVIKSGDKIIKEILIEAEGCL